MKQLKFNPKKDMKELEKYGFELCEENGKYEYETRNKDYLSINSWNGVVYSTTSSHTVHIEILILIYDLIKANLLIVESD